MLGRKKPKTVEDAIGVFLSAADDLLALSDKFWSRTEQLEAQIKALGEEHQQAEREMHRAQRIRSKLLDLISEEGEE